MEKTVLKSAEDSLVDKSDLITDAKLKELAEQRKLLEKENLEKKRCIEKLKEEAKAAQTAVGASAKTVKVRKRNISPITWEKSNSKKKQEEREAQLREIFHRARYFIIRSNNYENVALAKTRGVWSSPRQTEEKLNQAFYESPQVILIFTISGSGRFQGFARLASASTNDHPPVPWVLPTFLSNACLRRVFKLDWVNRNELSYIRTNHLRNAWNEGKQVKVSRDGMEVEPNCGEDVCRLFAPDDNTDMEAISQKAKRARKQFESENPSPPSNSIISKRSIEVEKSSRPLKDPIRRSLDDPSGPSFKEFRGMQSSVRSSSRANERSGEKIWKRSSDHSSGRSGDQPRKRRSSTKELSDGKKGDVKHRKISSREDSSERKKSPDYGAPAAPPQAQQNYHKDEWLTRRVRPTGYMNRGNFGYHYQRGSQWQPFNTRRSPFVHSPFTYSKENEFRQFSSSSYQSPVHESSSREYLHSSRNREYSPRDRENSSDGYSPGKKKKHCKELKKRHKYPKDSDTERSVSRDRKRGSYNSRSHSRHDSSGGHEGRISRRDRHRRSDSHGHKSGSRNHHSQDRRSVSHDRRSVGNDHRSVSHDRKSDSCDRRSDNHDRRSVSRDRRSVSRDRRSVGRDRRSVSRDRRSGSRDHRSSRSEHNGDRSVHSEHADEKSVHSEHLDDRSVHSEHYDVRSVHSEHDEERNVHSEHIDKRSIHSEHDEERSVHSDHRDDRSIGSEHDRD